MAGKNVRLTTKWDRYIYRLYDPNGLAQPNVDRRLSYSAPRTYLSRQVTQAVTVLGGMRWCVMVSPKWYISKTSSGGPEDQGGQIAYAMPMRPREVSYQR
jgi:hypothetical protein